MEKIRHFVDEELPNRVKAERMRLAGERLASRADPQPVSGNRHDRRMASKRGRRRHRTKVL